MRMREPEAAEHEDGEQRRICERDYLYGVGPLRILVTHVPHEIAIPGLEWVALLGVQMRWDGADERHRWVLVRMAALRANPSDRSTHPGQDDRSG